MFDEANSLEHKILFAYGYGSFSLVYIMIIQRL